MKFIKADVFMLPSKGDSVLAKCHINGENNLEVISYPITNGYKNFYTFQHLYIVSEEPIKQGDWVCNGEFVFQRSSTINLNVKCKKIIATTDTLPLNDCTNPWTAEHKYVPKIPNDFIRNYVNEYIKDNIIKNILVEYESKYLGKEYVDDQDAYGYDVYSDILKLNNNNISVKTLKKSWDIAEVIDLLIECCGKISSRELNKLIEK